MLYKIGDKVVIVNERTWTMNNEGLMDKYLGTTMTIERAIGTGTYFMKEDDGEWAWGDHCFVGLASEVKK